MKKFLFTAVSALAMSAAIAADSTQFGVLKVPSTAAQTIVSVPWLESGTDNAPVKVADLVLTAGLNVDDELKYYNGSAYECWKLTDDGQGKYWKASVTVSENGKIGTVAASDSATLSRGRAILLKRGGEIASQFYIMGKPASSSGGSLELPSGTKAQPAYTLIAPPTVAETTVGSLTWTNLVPGKDCLIIGSNYTMLTWTKQGFWMGEDGTNASSTTIPVGQGMWFMSSGAPESGTKSVRWE